MDAETYHRTVDIPNIPGRALPKGRALSNSELASLMAVCANDGTPAGVRDAALIAVLYTTGARRSEAIQWDLQDYSPYARQLIIRSGKGRKDRITYVENGAREALADWLSVRGSEPGALFVPIGKSGKLVVRRMADQSILYILRKRARQAGLKPFSPHDLRRSFVSDLLDAGVDVATAQQLAGHSSVQTTVRYDRRGESAKRKASKLLTVAYTRHQ